MRRKIYSNDVNAANCLRLSSKNRVFEFKLCEYINHIDSTKFWANKARDSIKIHQTQIYCYRLNGQKGVFRLRTIKCKWQLTKRGLIITQAICCVFFFAFFTLWHFFKRKYLFNKGWRWIPLSLSLSPSMSSLVFFSPNFYLRSIFTTPPSFDRAMAVVVHSSTRNQMKRNWRQLEAIAKSKM